MTAVWPAASTRLVALLGWPVRHSLSPLMHNAAFREHDLDLVYVALPVAPPHLARVVEVLQEVEAAGANVTVPHKEAVVARCDELTPEASLVGAVNTLSWTADGLRGGNTDASGFEEVVRDELGLGAHDAAVVLGTGGAARAAAAALGRLAAPVTVTGRRLDAAQAVAEVAARAGAADVAALDLGGPRVPEAVAAARLVVNATPLGMSGEELPPPFMRLAPGQVAYDMVYTPPETPFVAAARAGGADAHHGLSLLVAQAAASYRCWTGREAPIATMSAVALSAVARPHGRGLQSSAPPSSRP